MPQILVNPEMLNRIAEMFLNGRKQLEQNYIFLDKRIYEVHEQWSGMTQENFFREFRAFQEQRTATLDKMTFVGQELLTISKNFVQTDSEVEKTSARGGLDLNLMINEQKHGYTLSRTNEERDAYSQEADRIREAMRQKGYDESEIMQKTDPAMSEDQVMAHAWEETRKWAEGDPKGFGLVFAGRPVVQGAISSIEAARNTFSEMRKGEIVKAITDYTKGYANFYTDLGYKLAESVSNPGETLDKLTHSPTQAKTEFIASLASGFIFGKHVKKEHHGEGGSGGKGQGAGERKDDIKQDMLSSPASEKWGVLDDGTNQGIKHFADYWEKYPERIPSLAKRLGVDETQFENSVKGFESFSDQVQRVIENGKLREVNGKQLYYLDGAENPKKGVVVIVKNEKVQSMMPSDPKSFEKLQ